MVDVTSFANTMREKYPEGLTGIFAVGGTRTTYILKQGANADQPGKIQSFAEYAEALTENYLETIEMYFELGGKNMIIPVLSYQSFHERGDEYTKIISVLCLELINDRFLSFYRLLDIDPYFVGIDTLLHLPETHVAHRLGEELQNFQQAWSYKTGRRKVIWEIAPIPLFSFLHANEVMGDYARKQLEVALSDAKDLQSMHDLVYKYYSRAVYGTEIPMPHFYIGSNRNGDMKLRAMLPVSMLCGSPCRLFYTPYPSLFITRETLQVILEDLAFGKPLRSLDKDYAGKYTHETIEAEYQRVVELSSDPLSTLGLIRNTDVSAQE